ncbi:MAG: hypothetical protein JXR56_04865, partial [Candidatus Cloacimonetes bacterium]|nr:hypothetical protein [Candidatus Cloacimonadota bacterium]
MKKLILILLLSISMMLFAEIILYDEPYISELENGNVQVSVTVMQGIEEIHDAFFYYRPIGKTSYNLVKAVIDTGNNSDYTAELPLNIYSENGLEFYFEAGNPTGNLVSLPKFFPAEHPYKIGVSANSADTGFLILSPGTELDAEEDYIFSVSYFAIQDEIQLETMKVYFDGRDVTSKAVITPSMMVLKLSNVKPGSHSAELRVRTETGALLMTGKHRTQIISNKKTFELPFPLNGDATFRSNVYSISGDDDSNVALSDNDASLNMNLFSRSENAHRKGFWYDFRGNMYRDSKQNEYTQRYNRVSFDIEIPFLRVIMGDYTPNYSTFNMNNSNIYGMHAILKYHFLKLMYSTGENRRAINIEDANTGTFARDMSAFRLELGSSQSKHTSFLWGLHFSTTRDDINSIKEASYINITGADTLQTVFPEDNFVVGTDFTIFIPEQQSSLGAEV